MDEVLQALGLKYEDLTAEEKDTYKQLADKIQTKPLSIEDFKEAIIRLRESVSMELAEHESTNDKHDLALKARLKCYMTLEAMFLGPERARLALDAYISQLKAGEKK